MKHGYGLISILFCLALSLSLTAAAPVFAENPLDVVDAAQTVIQKNYPDRNSIARRIALEELETIARSGESDEQIVNAVLEKFPGTSAELSARSDFNFNGIPDEWEKQFKVSAGFAALESDEDADGFTLLQEYRAGTDPVDPFSHPKYITRVFVSAVGLQRFSGLELVSVHMSKPHWYSKDDWGAAFNVTRNGRKRMELVRIGDTFKYRDQIDFRVVDIEIDGKTQKPVVYLQRVGKEERIPCRSRQPVCDSLLLVKILDPFNARTVVSPVGGTFKLGSEKTGIETYRVVSTDPDTKITVVESVGEAPETFKIPPVPNGFLAAKHAADKAPAKTTAARTKKPASLKAPAGAAASARPASANAPAGNAASANAPAKLVAPARNPASANAPATAASVRKPEARTAEKSAAKPAAKKSKAEPLPIFHKKKNVQRWF